MCQFQWMWCKLFFVLNPNFVYLSCWQASHSLLEFFEIFGISRTTSFFLILIRLSKIMWPICLCHNQISSSLASRHDFVASSRTYMSFGAQLAVATILPYLPFLISHFVEFNNIVCPWSHICPTLSRLWFMFSTNRTFLARAYLLPRLTIPDRVTYEDLSFPKDTFPSFLSFRDTNFFLSLVICVEKPLSTYHTSLLFWALRVRAQLSILFFSHVCSFYGFKDSSWRFSSL